MGAGGVVNKINGLDHLINLKHDLIKPYCIKVFSAAFLINPNDFEIEDYGDYYKITHNSPSEDLDCVRPETIIIIGK